MTSSVSRRFGGSYVIDEIFLNDLRDIIKDVVEFNEEALTAEVDADVAGIPYLKSLKEKQAATIRTRARYAPRFTLVDVTCTQKNGTVRHNLGFDSILGANKADTRGLEAIKIEVGGFNKTRCLKIELANSYTPITFSLNGEYDWVDLTCGRLEKIIQPRKQIWGILASSSWFWLFCVLILPYLLLLPLAVLKYLFGSLFSPMVLNLITSYYDAIDGSSNLIFALQLLVVMLAFVFSKKVSKIWDWLFPKITFMFGDTEADARKRARVRLALVTLPITSVILPVLVDKI